MCFEKPRISENSVESGSPQVSTRKPGEPRGASVALQCRILTNVIRSSSAGLRAETKEISSFIFVSNVFPTRDLTLGTAFLTEPGDGRRNQTAARRE